MSLKRIAEQEVNQDDDSDDDFGPMPMPSSSSETNDVKTDNNSSSNNNTKKIKIKKTLPFEKTYIDALPSGSSYEHSFMHRDIVTHVAVAKSAEFIITGSVDGHVKFWKKMPDNIEFVKHYQAHLGE